LIHTADWHLGMTRRFLQPEHQARYSEARLDAVRAIARLAREEDAAFVLACGDVFDSNHVDRQVIARALDAMRGFEVPLLILPGNHDPLDAASVYRSRAFTERAPDAVTVIADATPVAIGGLEVVGAPWNARRPGTDPSAEVIAALEPGPRRVLAAHGVVDVLSPDADDPEAIAMGGLTAALDDGRVAYVALGDRHSATEVGGDPRVRYPGTPVATDYGEVDPGNVLVVDIDAEGVRAMARRVGEWAFVRREVRLAGAGDVDALDADLAALPDKARTVVRLDLIGALTPAEDARLDAMLADQADLFAALTRSERGSDLAVVAHDDDLDALGLSGYAQSAAEEIAAIAAGDGPDHEAARDALRLLYRLARHDA
jgi:DNA repair exonuclease SbcCD nuclease subunit